MSIDTPAARSAVTLAVGTAAVVFIASLLVPIILTILFLVSGGPVAGEDRVDCSARDIAAARHEVGNPCHQADR